MSTTFVDTHSGISLVRRATRVFTLDPVLAILLATGAITVVWLLCDLLLTTGGRLVYTLDDPYITLALSERIAQGHYGINAGEAASPSSSILYPFLLVPGAGTAFHVAIPLVLNVASTALTLWATARIVRLSDVASGMVPTLLVAALVVISTLFINLYGVIFSGLEHSLHVTATVVILAGLIETAERHRVPRWLLAAIVLAPLVRFEGIVASGAAIVVLGAFGAWRRALVAATTTAGCLALYFAAMHALGLPPLPISVTAKSHVAIAMERADLVGGLSAVMRKIDAIKHYQAAKLLVGITALTLLRPVLSAFLAPRAFRWRAALIPGFIVAVTAGQVLGGNFNWFERYDVYALAVGQLGLLYVYRREWKWIFEAIAKPGHPVRFAAGVVAYVAVVHVTTWYDPYHWQVTRETAPGAYNIYEQQSQMSRFVRDFYRAPVAVNDLGYVAWRNPHYVLDIVGLGTPEVRRTRHDPSFTALTRRHDVGLAMIYDRPGRPRPGWTPVAYLRLNTSRVTPAGTAVTFYRTPVGSAEKISLALLEFKASLPPEIVLDLWPDCGTRIPLTELTASVPDGSPTNAPRVVQFRCPLTITLDRTQLLRRLHIQADSNDEYELRMMKDGVTVARAIVEFVPAPGLRTRIVETPGVRADSIVIDGVGDNRFSLGRLDVVSQPN